MTHVELISIHAHMFMKGWINVQKLQYYDRPHMILTKYLLATKQKISIPTSLAGKKGNC